MTRNIFCLLLIYFLHTHKAHSQNTSARACAFPESSQFDFWLGRWDLTYNDTVHAFNEITKELDGCVVHEHFKSPSAKFRGESWSVYNPKTKKWQQTWVDDQGAYITLRGGVVNNDMVLFTEPAIGPKGNKVQYRMTFCNITPDRFDWKWESTMDETKTWKPNWVIHYQRQK